MKEAVLVTVLATWFSPLLFCSRVISAHFSVQIYCAIIFLMQALALVLFFIGKAKNPRWIVVMLSIGLILGWILPALVPGFVAGMPMTMPRF